MNLNELKKIAQAMIAPGKGILAIDESMGTCTKRFEALGIKCNEENRRQYRQLLVTAPEAEKWLSGIILFDETLRQKTDDGILFTEVLKNRGIIPGIKVDKGAKDLALHRGEKITEGLDGLRERLREYKTLGAQFAKWRAVITIGKDMPSDACLDGNCHALARYAALCQEAGVVPMVEPEILLEGDHSIEKCYEVSTETWMTLFEELEEQGVSPEGIILKTSMILPGKNHEEQADLQTIAEMTVKGLIESLPHNLAGVVFLSGGQSDKEATIRLNKMNQLSKHPWPLSFSYGRSIQRPALETWAKDRSAVSEAQKKLVHRAKCNAYAAKGEYNEEIENSK